MITPSIKLTFIVYGEDLNPQVFSEVSKLSPTNAWLKGDPLPEYPHLTTKVTAYRKETAWELAIEDINIWNTNELGDRLMEKLAPQQEKIIQYIQDNGLTSKIDIVAEMSEGKVPSMVFTNQFLDLVVKMNGWIDCDLYVNKG